MFYSLSGARAGRHGTVGRAQGGLLGLVVLLLLLLHGGHLLGLAQTVDGDGQEDVEQGVVAEHGEEDEVERLDQAGLGAALGLDAVVHDLVPVLARENLEREGWHFGILYALHKGAKFHGCCFSDEIPESYTGPINSEIVPRAKRNFFRL